MKSRIIHRALAAGFFASGVVTAIAFAAAATPADESSQQSSALGASQPGNYLAAIAAADDRDTASAEVFYREALRADPRNSDLLERAFAAALSNGDELSANSLAERLLVRDASNNMARLAIAVHAIGQGQYGAARAELAGGDGPRSRDVTTALIAAWCYAGQGDLRHALDTLDRIRDPSIAAFRDYHAGLIADLLGNPNEARRRLKAAYDNDKNTLRVVDAYGRFLASHGDFDGARKVYNDFSILVPHHPIVESALADLDAKHALDPLVRDAKEGAAEALYGLGGAGSRQQGDELPALIYLRLSLYLRPSNDLAAVTLANLFDELKQNEQAIAAYGMVPSTSPLREGADIQSALELDALEKPDEAMRRLNEIVAKRPHDVDALSSLAGLQRSVKKYAEAAATYDKAIAAVGIPLRDNWTLFYFRGICYERDKQWPKAEADFKKALDLFPDQPLVLNYLGYTWVDRGEHLKEAIKMLQKAVEQKPDDGFIIDSLAWAYYRLGQYDKAVVYQEKAVSLEPGDSVLNDHLGDIYWKLGRHNEARFQWQRALAFKPDADRVAPIEAKLQHGLDAKGTGG